MRSLVVRTRPGAFVAPWTLGSMHRQLENWMDRAFGGPAGDFLEPRLALSPRIDFAETEKGYELSADLPGLDEKDIDVSVADNVLTIKGERTFEEHSHGRNVHLNERGHGSFRRTLRLPDDVDDTAIEASLGSGVLRIRLPKSKEAAPAMRQIKVRAH